MKLLKLGAATLNQTPMDWDGNLQHILTAIFAAQQQQIDVLCLPELCISGYGCEDAFLGLGLLQQARRVLLDIVPHTQGLIVSVGLPVLQQNRVYNCACLIADGSIAGFVAKRFLPRDGVHYEPRWFHAWSAGVRDVLHIDGQAYPFGDLLFNCGGVLIGFEICEEAWVANRPGIHLAQQGVDIILNPTASHFAFAKHSTRLRLVLEGSRAFSCSYVYANLLGNEAGRMIYDGDTLIASNNQMLAAGERFSFGDWELISASVDIDLTRMTQARTSRFVQNQHAAIQVPFDYPPRTPSQPDEGLKARKSLSKEEEFAYAEALALYDYLRKSRAWGFALSLSGGADSGAIACLIRIMVELGVKNLGMEVFCAKLASPHLDTSNIDTLVRSLLVCVYQSTRNSSEITRNAAEQIAQAIGAEYLQWSVDETVENYRGIVSQALGRELNWQQDDLALQNIQARARAPGVWLLANVRNALLLATSNRSEAAVGYATMDGDTSGGLSPLAGIDKHFIRHWLGWLETQGICGLAPIPALRYINAQQPTAELRPDAQQTDEADLMPYDLLNAIEKAAIRDRQTPYEIYYLLQSQFAYSEEQLLTWIERFFQLWVRNQWKRERYAPSFHLDDENLDPRSWCRFPILSGGFAHELRQMRLRVKTGF